ncbi:MAG: OmpH family outer membrane protein [Flavobacterium sp.]
MKKVFLIVGCALAMIACNKTETATEGGFKTAYVDTAKLLDEYQAAKDIESKYKVKSEEMGRELEGKAQQWKLDAASFRREAQAKGPEWAQLKGQELQKREQEIGMMQQAMMQQLQKESGNEMDTLVKQIKQHIKDYGKKNGYEYIYGTGDAATVLYAKEQYDITEKILKDLNDKYKPEAKDTKDEAKKAE